MYKKMVPADVNARRIAASRAGGGAHSRMRRNKVAPPSAHPRTPHGQAGIEPEIGQLCDKCAHLLSELEDMKKRVARETEQRLTAQHEAMRRLLSPVLEDLERALASVHAVQANNDLRRRSRPRATAPKSASGRLHPNSRKTGALRRASLAIT